MLHYKKEKKRLTVVGDIENKVNKNRLNCQILFVNNMLRFSLIHISTQLFK